MGRAAIDFRLPIPTIHAKSMKIRLEEIFEEPTDANFAAAAEDVNARLSSGREVQEDFRLVEPLGVDVRYYRAGENLYFSGSLSTRLSGTCGRCLAGFTLAQGGPFQFVLAPRAPQEADQELVADDLALSFFSGTEIDLEPLCTEQLILSLPTRALCAEECRGLCPTCGADRNEDACSCSATPPDPRWAALREWKPPQAS